MYDFSALELFKNNYFQFSTKKIDASCKSELKYTFYYGRLNKKLINIMDVFKI